MKKDVLLLLNKIAQAVFDKKGSNILALDVRPCSVESNYVIIAEGSVDKHVKAIAQSVEKTMEEEGWKVCYTQGMQGARWIVVDFSLIAVHLFVPEERERYQLERLWQKSEIVDVVIDVPEKPLPNYTSI
jgi:ribosome-associated protein